VFEECPLQSLCKGDDRFDLLSAKSDYVIRNKSLFLMVCVPKHSPPLNSGLSSLTPQFTVRVNRTIKTQTLLVRLPAMQYRILPVAFLSWINLSISQTPARYIRELKATATWSLSLYLAIMCARIPVYCES
jgi:hypothetical protein